MAKPTLAPALAGKVHDILVACAGARRSDLHSFVFAMGEGCEEYRFGGSLGFGGKFWTERFAVSCYPEDETIMRLAVIDNTNQALSLLRRQESAR